MHEFSLAQEILEIAENSLREHQGAVVTELTLDIGSLAGVEIPALEMALESLKTSSVMEHAAIRMNRIEAQAECRNCHHRFMAENITSECPVCHAYNPRILTGKELIVRTIKME